MHVWIHNPGKQRNPVPRASFQISTSGVSMIFRRSLESDTEMPGTRKSGCRDEKSDLI